MRTFSMVNRRLRAHNEQVPENSASWLTTFNDMVTLLMVFFVLLFSMGSMNADRFKQFVNGLQSAMGVLDEGRHSVEGVIHDRQVSVFDRSMADDASQSFQALARSEGLEAEYTRKGLRVTLRDELLFRSGSANLTGEGLRLLDEISTIVKPMQRRIRIEGHTDDRSIATLRFPSNWELSTARAVRVATYLIQHGGIEPTLLSAAGYGSSRPRVPNDSEVHRGLNRRVEVILGQTASGVY
ncbi:MAG: flagellar motor protein MotB [Desulfobacteraceae bacterium]|nr:MAG: flagellar motor protein MotB [Desulfobacteraceae bacterium]